MLQSNQTKIVNILNNSFWCDILQCILQVVIATNYKTTASVSAKPSKLTMEFMFAGGLIFKLRVQIKRNICQKSFNEVFINNVQFNFNLETKFHRPHDCLSSNYLLS